jgi:hypothetical protein
MDVRIPAQSGGKSPAAGGPQLGRSRSRSRHLHDARGCACVHQRGWVLAGLRDRLQHPCPLGRRGARSELIELGQGIVGEDWLRRVVAQPGRRAVDVQVIGTGRDRSLPEGDRVRLGCRRLAHKSPRLFRQGRPGPARARSSSRRSSWTAGATGRTGRSRASDHRGGAADRSSRRRRHAAATGKQHWQARRCRRRLHV